MAFRRLVTLWGMLLLSGCLYHARERADQAVCDLVARPIDLETSGETEPGKTTSHESLLPTDKGVHILPASPMDIQTAAWMQVEKEQPKVTDIKSRLKIPPEIPGSEAPLIKLPQDPMEKQKAIKELYPDKLPPLPSEPVPQPGPDGKPYTLATLQQIAAGNSPQLRQAAADVEAARGNLIQARAYPNPTVGYEVDPSNDGSAPGVQGIFIDQPIKTGGKLKLQAAAAQKDLENAELALKRARSDLATQVRNAFFALVVAKETVRVNRALARFTDEVYRIQADLLASGFAAPYEPAALRSQAFTARLSLKQSIDNYIYSWEKLVATLGLKKLPLTEVAGRVDRLFPIYDYDKVLAHILSRHTDVLTARNTLDKARYNLKLAQTIPAFPDLDLRVAFLKEFVLPPKQFVH
ncbi:MAG TPA: TolC family protein, partial [Gemmataceae bacterium]|nr:TolC family protein [Gemmataceae bacterium]